MASQEVGPPRPADPDTMPCSSGPRWCGRRPGDGRRRRDRARPGGAAAGGSTNRCRRGSACIAGQLRAGTDVRPATGRRRAGLGRRTGAPAARRPALAQRPGSAAGTGPRSRAGTGAGRPSAPPVTVAVLDTGVAAHPWFAHRPWFAQVTDDQFEVLDANHDGRLDSVAGHGTFVAGVVQQHAPSARLRIRRVLHTDGICDEVGLIEALSVANLDRSPPRSSICPSAGTATTTGYRGCWTGRCAG